jgi:hypothetical protein
MDTPFDYFFNDRTNPTTIEALRNEHWAEALEELAKTTPVKGKAAGRCLPDDKLLAFLNNL